MDKVPDFVGRWFYGPIYQNFSMHIESRRKFDKKFDEIEGKILDVFGEAYFKGRIGSDKISFVKEYCPCAIEKGAAPLVMYRGERTHNSNCIDRYVGEYVICERINICKEPDSGLIILAHNDGFVMQRHFDFRMN